MPSCSPIHNESATEKTFSGFSARHIFVSFPGLLLLYELLPSIVVPVGSDKKGENFPVWLRHLFYSLIHFSFIYFSIFFFASSSSFSPFSSSGSPSICCVHIYILSIIFYETALGSVSAGKQSAMFGSRCLDHDIHDHFGDFEEIPFSSFHLLLQGLRLEKG